MDIGRQRRFNVTLPALSSATAPAGVDYFLENYLATIDMSTTESQHYVPVSITEIPDEELQELRGRIVSSGTLGRSPVYLQLFDYLLECAQQGRQPKEFEIAVDVLGRDGTFDVTKDSVVRVYVHQLRKRLDKYFLKLTPQCKYRLSIPKGQYTVNASRAPSPVEALSATDGTPPQHAPDAATARTRHRMLSSLLVIVAALLLLTNVWQWQLRQGAAPDTPVSQALSHSLWQSLMDDDMPILIVMGDYYIFGETDESGRVTRMVRDFFINSRQDLADLFMQDNTLQTHFRDLDMSYMPEGAASALLQIAPIVTATGKRVNVRMMSRITTADLRSNHIIYIGYISAMDRLNNMYFPASGLLPGRTYDELYNRDQQIFYTSTAGLPELGEPFRDLALLSTWTAARGNRFILVSGTRDAGLMHAANVAASAAELSQLDAALDPGTLANTPGYEALYEVYGIDRMNFDAGLLYHQPLDPDRIWQR